MMSIPEAYRSMEANLELTCLKAISICREFMDYDLASRFASFIRWRKAMMQGGVNNLLYPEGELHDIMIIGINPSHSSGFKSVWDDKFGRDFLEYLKKAGIERKEVWMTNLYKHSTPDNRRLDKKEVIEGFSILSAEIEWVDPVEIIAMGSQVYNCFGIKSPFESAGWRGRRVHSIYHPSYLSRIRDPGLDEKFISFLKKIHDEKGIR